MTAGNTMTPVPDIDGDSLNVYLNNPAGERIVSIHAEGSRDYDRAGALRLIETIQSAVQAADDHVAAVAAEAEKAARRLKVGDIVHPQGDTYPTRTVITDENEDGRVDLVNIRSRYGTEGHIQRGVIAADYTKRTTS